MTTEQKRKQIAEALGWTFDPDTDTWHEPECTRWKEGMPCLLDCCDVDDLPNPYSSAEASMGLLEAMPEAQLWLENKENPRLWGCWADYSGESEEGYAAHTDLKTAIAEAFRASRGLKDE